MKFFDETFWKMTLGFLVVILVAIVVIVALGYNS